MFSELKSPKMVAVSKPMEPSGIYGTMENVIKHINARLVWVGAIIFIIFSFSIFFPDYLVFFLSFFVLVSLDSPIL
jgi:hypothetical protein